MLVRDGMRDYHAGDGKNLPGKNLLAMRTPTAMAEAERVTIAFSEAIASQIRSAVDAGEYQSPSDVVQDASRLWSESRTVPGEHDVEDLRRAWDAGKTGGLLGSLDFEELRREARSPLQAKTALSHEVPDLHHAD